MASFRSATFCSSASLLSTVFMVPMYADRPMKVPTNSTAMIKLRS